MQSWSFCGYEYVSKRKADTVTLLLVLQFTCWTNYDSVKVDLCLEGQRSRTSGQILEPLHFFKGDMLCLPSFLVLSVFFWNLSEKSLALTKLPDSPVITMCIDTKTFSGRYPKSSKKQWLVTMTTDTNLILLSNIDHFRVYYLSNYLKSNRQYFFNSRLFSDLQTTVTSRVEPLCFKSSTPVLWGNWRALQSDFHPFKFFKVKI